tara:strand:+ start:2151 stop:2297 length:147 start_codon:yes stop_codon:yes gene_type:complete
MKITFEETVQRVKAINETLIQDCGLTYEQLDEFWAEVFKKVEKQQNKK